MTRQVRTLWLASAALISATAAVMIAARFRTPAEAAPPPALALTATGSPAGIHLHWDTSTPEVRRADGGTIEVLDGGRIERIPVSSETVRTGSFNYEPKSEDVVLAVALHRSGIPLINGVMRTVGNGPAPPKRSLRPAPDRRRIETGERSRKAEPPRRSSRRRR